MNKTVLIEDKLIYFSEFLNKGKATEYFKILKNEIEWSQDEIMIYGKKRQIPRLSSWYGDKNATYKYSGLDLIPLAWTKELKEIKEVAERLSEANFNSVLLNYYRNGADSMGWHSDNEKEIEKHSPIASVSFGEVRRFLVRSKEDKQKKLEINLENGSILIMKGDFQDIYQHSVPKTAKDIDGRINLTFRKINL